ncbi:Uncharacterised protein [Vibrio cholerae]|nr:Uncharacterised protein [Vibrio cholerae]CSI93009.1 Uncharacterised protein [Vibrio cholerae]
MHRGFRYSDPDDAGMTSNNFCKCNSRNEDPVVLYRFYVLHYGS